MWLRLDEVHSVDTRGIAVGEAPRHPRNSAMTQPAAQSAAVELPPLPKQSFHIAEDAGRHGHHSCYFNEHNVSKYGKEGVYLMGYSADQMRDFARAAIAADRELRAVGGEPAGWREHAAQWLRGKAEAAQPASEATGWANPAHSLPDRLQRLADELDAEQESAPFGLEPWETPVVNKFGDSMKPEVQRFMRGMHSHLLGNAASPAVADKVLPSEAQLLALLSGSYYMDPPDGGSVTLYEQLQRMSKDAAKWREFDGNARVVTARRVVSEPAPTGTRQDSPAAMKNPARPEARDSQLAPSPFEKVLPSEASEMTEAQERIAFEAEIGGPPFEKSVDRYPDDHQRFAWPGNYRDIEVDLAWNIWRARAAVRSGKQAPDLRDIMADIDAHALGCVRKAAGEDLNTNASREIVRRGIEALVGPPAVDEGVHMLDPDSDDAQGLAAPPGWWKGHNAATDIFVPIIDGLQAKIDSLMLEYCPGEMTEEQKMNWEAHQHPASAEDQAVIDNAVRGGRGK
jgi:hypothetical protein